VFKKLPYFILQSICLPEVKPDACLQETWDQLVAADELPPCWILEQKMDYLR